MVVVKKRKKSKKGKGSGRKEGEKRKTSKAENPSPEPEEQGRPSVCRERPRPRPSLRFVRGHVCICTCRSHARTRCSFMHSLARSVCVFFAPLLSSPVSLAVSVLLTLRQTVFFLCVCKRAQCVAFVCTSGPPRRRPVLTLLPSHAVHCEVVSHVAVRGAATENSFPPRCFRIRRSILPPHGK